MEITIKAKDRQGFDDLRSELLSAGYKRECMAHYKGTTVIYVDKHSRQATVLCSSYDYLFRIKPGLESRPPVTPERMGGNGVEALNLILKHITPLRVLDELGRDVDLEPFKKI